MSTDISQSAFYFDRAARDLWINLQILNPCQRRGAQFDTANDAVPISLRVIRNAVRVLADVDDHPIIHADGEAVFAGRHLAKVVLVRGAERGIRSNDLVIKPDAR